MDINEYKATLQSMTDQELQAEECDLVETLTLIVYQGDRYTTRWHEADDKWLCVVKALKERGI